MPAKKTAKEVMIDVFEFPHIPYWFTIKQAIEILKKTKENAEKKCLYPQVIMVFDEKDNLMGTLSPLDILKGLEPVFVRTDVREMLADTDEDRLSEMLANIFISEAKELAGIPVNAVMFPVKAFVSPDDPVTKAALLMLHHNLVILPVLENKKKLIGVLRMQEVFEEVSKYCSGELNENILPYGGSCKSL